MSYDTPEQAWRHQPTSDEINAERYAKIRRMDVVTFRDLSNKATTYEEFDALVDAYVPE